MTVTKRTGESRWQRIRDFILHGVRDPAPDEAHDPALRWHEPGPSNPFGIRVFDCQSMTRTLVTMTSDPNVAATFGTLRSSDGRDLAAASIKDAVNVTVSLRIPSNGVSLDGALFKAQSMEEKWDIYGHDSTLLFARSWTGELCFRAAATNGPDGLHISNIQCRRSEVEEAASHVYFLIANHVMGVVLPHRVPRNTPADPTSIATMSFALFGNRAWYATFEDITQIPIPHHRT